MKPRGKREREEQPPSRAVLRFLIGDELGFVKFISVSFDVDRGPDWDSARIEARW